jgi:hypothetical protein
MEEQFNGVHRLRMIGNKDIKVGEKSYKEHQISSLKYVSSRNFD